MSLSKSTAELPPKKSNAEKRLITKILAYSAKKIKAKPALPYSTLKPDTSSDSPSAKSKGARFVSAIHVTNQTKDTGIIKNLNQIISCDSLISIKLNVPTKNSGNKRTKAILTS